MSELKFSVEGKVAFISGANRGIGKAIAIALLEKGARRVYAGARDTRSLNNLMSHYFERLVPVELDVTKEDTIARAAETARDVQILVNNAGVLNVGGFFAKDGEESLKGNLDVNVWGLVKLSRAFIDILKQNQPGAIINISSVAGLGNMPIIGTYSASKSAVHSITQGMRWELAKENIGVMGVYPGPIDTDMAKGFEMEKDSPENVANDIVRALLAGEEDVFPDVMSKQVGKTYATDPKAIERAFGEYQG